MDLFKYCGKAGAGIFKSRSIWFSQPQHLNDPFELNPSAAFREPDRSVVLEMIRDEYLARFKDFKMPFNAFKEVVAPSVLAAAAPAKESRQQVLMEDLNRTVALLCLTTTDDNLTMWSHYAEQHQGFVIRFNGAHEFFRFARKVTYSNRRPWVGLDKGTEGEAQEILYTKSTHWAHEAEYRLIQSVKNGREVRTPSGHPAYAFDLPANCITGVIFGCKAPWELREGLEQELLHPEFQHVEIMEARIHPNEFRLDRIARHGKTVAAPPLH